MSDAFDLLKGKLSKEHQSILERLQKRKFDECRKIIIDEIETDKLHSDIINICAYAFSESGPLSNTGYHFITVDPLYNTRDEKGNKIFDILLFNKDDKRAILIECKTSVSNTSSLMNDLMDQINNSKRHLKELEEETGGQIDDLEFVICCTPQDTEEIGKKVNNEPVCLWSTDLFFFTLKLFNIRNSNDSKETGILINKGQLHKNENLRVALYKKIESRGQIDGFKISPSSHLCRIMSRVLYRIVIEIIPNNSEKKFWIHELKEILRKELPKVSFMEIDRISKIFYEKASEMEIIDINETLEKDLSFTLKINFRSIKSIEKEIIERYGKYKCQSRSREEAIKEYEEMLKTSKESLDYFFKQGKEKDTK